ncbi:MAG: hypothetical protein WAN09_15005, partial [Candidatus Korobacteraceae bacterium]
MLEFSYSSGRGEIGKFTRRGRGGGKSGNPAALAGFPNGGGKSRLWTFPRSGFFHGPFYPQILLQSHNKILRPVSPYEGQNCYFPCFHAILFKTIGYNQSRGVNLPTDFVFDEKGKIGAYAVSWYEHLKEAASDNIRPLFGSTPIFRDDKKVLPLQVADLVGWHIHRKLETPGY